MNEYKFLTYYFGILILVVCIAGGLGVLEINTSMFVKETNSQTNMSISKDIIYNNCKDYVRIDEYISCIEHELEPVFIYNLTDDYINLSFDEIMTRGGDCKNWAEFWKEYLDLKGFDSRFEILSVDEYTNHMIVMTSTKDGFCMISNGNSWCSIYG